MTLWSTVMLWIDEPLCLAGCLDFDSRFLLLLYCDNSPCGLFFSRSLSCSEFFSQFPTLSEVLQVLHLLLLPAFPAGWQLLIDFLHQKGSDHCDYEYAGSQKPLLLCSGAGESSTNLACKTLQVFVDYLKVYSYADITMKAFLDTPL